MLIPRKIHIMCDIATISAGLLESIKKDTNISLNVFVLFFLDLDKNSIFIQITKFWYKDDQKIENLNIWTLMNISVAWIFLHVLFLNAFIFL